MRHLGSRELRHVVTVAGSHVSTHQLRVPWTCPPKTPHILQGSLVTGGRGNCWPWHRAVSTLTGLHIDVE